MKGLLADVRTLPRGVWFVCAGTFANRFGSFVITFLVLYLTDRGFSPADAGGAVGAYGIGHFAAVGIGGVLADRFGRRETIALSMFSSAGAMLLLATADSLLGIVTLTALAGFAAELYRPASSALITDLVPQERRVTAFALYRLAINAGFAAGPAVAGLVAERSFVWLFVGDAITSIVYGTIALVALPRTRPPEPRVDEQPVEKRSWLRVVLRDGSFMIFCASSLLGAFVYLQANAGLPLHVRAEGHSAATYGLLMALNGLIIVCIELPFTAVTRRFPARPVMSTGVLLVGFGFMTTMWAHSPLALAGTVALWTLGEIVNAPIASAYVASLAPIDMRGRYMGTWAATFSLGLFLGPTVGSRLFEVSPATLWTTCGVLSLIASVLLLVPRERFVRPAVPVEPAPGVPGVES